MKDWPGIFELHVADAIADTYDDLASRLSLRTAKYFH